MLTVTFMKKEMKNGDENTLNIIYELPAELSTFFNASFRGQVNEVKYEHDCKKI